MDLFINQLNAEIKKNFPRIEKLFSQESLYAFAHQPKNQLYQYRFGLGTSIRYTLLRPHRKLYKCFIQYGITDTGLMAMIVIERFYEELQSRLYKDNRMR